MKDCKNCKHFFHHFLMELFYIPAACLNNLALFAECRVERHIGVCGSEATLWEGIGVED